MRLFDLQMVIYSDFFGLICFEALVASISFVAPIFGDI